MSKGKPVHVTPRGENGWAVIREVNDRASSVHPTQAEAERVGRENAHRDETAFFPHRRDGRIRERDTYGHDPYPPHG